MYSGVPRTSCSLGELAIQVLELLDLDGGHAEIDELHGLLADLVARYEDVARLEVAMDDAVGVGVGDRRAHAAADLHRVGDRQALPRREDAVERAPFEHLEHDVRARALPQTPASSTSTNPGWRTAVKACASRSRRRRVSF